MRTLQIALQSTIYTISKPCFVTYTVPFLPLLLVIKVSVRGMPRFSDVLVNLNDENSLTKRLKSLRRSNKEKKKKKEGAGQVYEALGK